MERRRPRHAQLIHDARIGKGWTLERLSATLRHPVTRAHLSDIEQGRREPGIGLMDDLATALDLPYDYFCWLLGRWPADLRDDGVRSQEAVTAAFAAFRAALDRGRPRKPREDA